MPGRLPSLSLLLCICANVTLFLEYAGIVMNVVTLDLCLQKLGAIRYDKKMNKFLFSPLGFYYICGI